MLLAHLSDPHIRTGPLAGEPAAKLHHVLGRILALQPQPDCVVITGDLTQYGDAAAYADLHALIESFPLPVHLTTGNHDDPEALLSVFGGSRFLNGGTTTRYRVDYPAATVIVLDSHRSGSPAGLLGDEQLAWLDAQLSHRPDQPAFVCLHHPPTPIGIPFLDDMRLEDGDALGEVVARHRHVSLILAGHVHRAIVAPFAGTMMAVAPSTYRQSGLRLHDAQPPGYFAEPNGFLLHQILDGNCITHVVPASHAAAELGYF